MTHYGACHECGERAEHFDSILRRWYCLLHDPRRKVAQHDATVPGSIAAGPVFTNEGRMLQPRLNRFQRRLQASKARRRG